MFSLVKIKEASVACQLKWRNALSHQNEKARRKNNLTAKQMTQAVSGLKADSSQGSILSTWSSSVSEVSMILAEYISCNGKGKVCTKYGSVHIKFWKCLDYELGCHCNSSQQKKKVQSLFTQPQILPSSQNILVTNTLQEVLFVCHMVCQERKYNVFLFMLEPWKNVPFFPTQLYFNTPAAGVL